MTLAEFKALWRMGFRPMLLRSLIKRRLIWKLDAGQVAFIGEVTLATAHPPRANSPLLAKRGGVGGGDFTELYGGER